MKSLSDLSTLPFSPRVSRNLDSSVYCTIQGTPAQGKQGKWPKNIPCQGKHREFGNFAKTQGIWFAQVVNFLILKVKDISKFAATISKNMLNLVKSAESVFCM